MSPANTTSAVIFGEFARAAARKNYLAIEMSTADLIHRLRLREHQARDRHDQGLAEDLRRTIEALQRLERERLFVRPPMAGQPAH